MLSQAPIKTSASTEENNFLEENLPANTAYLNDLREQLKSEIVCARVMLPREEGWLMHSSKDPTLKSDWAEQAFFTRWTLAEDGLLLKGTRLVIHSTMRNDVLTRIHKGHQGVVKCGGVPDNLCGDRA